VPLLRAATVKEIDLAESKDVVEMLIRDDTETAMAHLPKLFSDITKKHFYVIPSSSEKHFKEFAKYLLEQLLFQCVGGVWKPTRLSPRSPRIQKEFELYIKAINKTVKNLQPKAKPKTEFYEVELPPELKKSRKKKKKTLPAEAKATEFFGPAMPNATALAKNLKRPTEINGKTVKGPSMPNAMDLMNKKGPSDESSEDEAGPANIMDGESLSTSDRKRLMKMEQAREMNRITNKYKKSAVKKSDAATGRESWMTAPDAGGLDFLSGSKRSRFTSGKGLDDSWTMTPGERTRRKLMEKEKQEMYQKFGVPESVKQEREEVRKQEEAQGMPEKPTEMSLFELSRINLGKRIVTWEIKNRRGETVGRRPGSSNMEKKRFEMQMNEFNKFAHGETHGVD